MQASAADAQWIVEGYLLALSALMLFGGALGDRYGRRLMFGLGTALFALASLVCALAPDVPILVAARVVQGIGGMLLAPASLAIIGACFEAGVKRDRAYAAWSAYGALTTAIGPALGGVMIDHFGWRSVFLINLPLAALVVWATIAHVTESKDDDARKEGRLDVSGAFLATVGLGGITYALIAMQGGARDPRVWGAALAGAIALIAFVAVEARAKAPIMPLALFADRTFSGINAATLLLYGCVGALFYFLPFDMIQGHGYSATAAAVAMFPFVIGLTTLARAGTALARRFGGRVVLCAGPSIVAVGCVLLAVFERGDTYWSSFFPGLCVIAIGMGLTVAPLTATVMGSAQPRHIGAASGINNAVARTAGLLAIAALGAVLWYAFNARLDASLATTHASAAQRAQVDVERPKLAGATIADARLHGEIIAAYRGGFTDVAFGSALLAFGAGLVSLTTIGRRNRAAGRTDL